MLKAIIIDDEPGARQALANDLKSDYPEICIVDSCSTAAAGFEAIKKYEPDVVFLDIEMPGMNGMDMLKQFDNIFFDVIFCTGHAQYAIQAFRISSVVDYLQKPIKKEELAEALSRVQLKSTHGIPKEHIDILLQNMIQPTKISLRSGEGLDFLNINKIIYAKSEGNYITVYLNQPKPQKITYSTFTLKRLEERLPENMFCRIDQSYLVNLSYVVGFKRGDRDVLLENGQRLPASKSGQSLLLAKLGEGN